jgi:hypothetical protein
VLPVDVVQATAVIAITTREPKPLPTARPPIAGTMPDKLEMYTCQDAGMFVLFAHVVSAQYDPSLLQPTPPDMMPLAKIAYPGDNGYR